MFIAKLLSDINGFHKKSFASYIGVKIFKQANEALLSEYDGMEFQDENLFSQMDTFVEKYKELISDIDSLESAPDVELLEKMTDDIGTFSKLGILFDKIMDNPYLKTRESEVYLEEFAPENLLTLVQKMYADANERYSNSDVISDYLIYKEGEGGTSEIANDFKDIKIDKKDFGEGGGMRGGGGKSKYDPVAAKQRRMDEKKLKDDARKATSEEIAADMRLQRGMKLIQDAAFRYAKNRENPEWVERNRAANKVFSLNYQRKVQKGLAKSVREDLISKIENARSSDEKEVLIQELSKLDSSQESYNKIQKKHNDNYHERVEALNSGEQNNLAFKAVTREFGMSINTQRSELRKKYQKDVKYQTLREQLIKAKDSKIRDAIHKATENLYLALSTHVAIENFEKEVAPAIQWREQLDELFKRDILDNLHDELKPHIKALADDGKNIKEKMELNSLCRPILPKMSAVIYFLYDKIGHKPTKSAKSYFAILKSAQEATEADVDQIIAKVDSMNLTDSAAYADKIISMILSELR